MTVDDQLQHLKGDKDQAGLEGTDVIDACILWVIVAYPEPQQQKCRRIHFDK